MKISAFVTTLFLATTAMAQSQASKCWNFDISGAYQCGNGLVTISQYDEEFTVSYNGVVDTVVADGKMRIADFRDYGRPVQYTATCFSFNPTLSYKMTSTHSNSVIRSVELSAVENDVVISYNGYGARCTRQ